MTTEWNDEDDTQVEQINIFFSDLSPTCQNYLRDLISEWENKDEILSSRYALGSLDKVLFHNLMKYKQ